MPGNPAKAAVGALHDADTPDDVPEVFHKNPDGLQSIVVKNLRIRVKYCGFAERIAMSSIIRPWRMPMAGRNSPWVT